MPRERRDGPGQENRRQECRRPISVVGSEIAVCENRVGVDGEAALRAVLVKRVLRRLERTGGERSR
jgi:hypothetical protein